MKFFLYVVVAILILLLMIMIHEFGHYIAGKILKFKINEFAIGFGPKIFSKKKKNGEIFSIRLLPLGGFCAFEGESEDEENPPKTEVFKEIETTDKAEVVKEDKTNQTDLKRFNDQKPWKRIIVLLAGGVFNLLSAIIFSFIYIIIVGYNLPIVNKVYTNPDTQQPYSVLEPGDQILKVNNKEISIMNSLGELLNGYGIGDTIVFTVVRDGETLNLISTIHDKVVNDSGNERQGHFGFTLSDNYEKLSFGKALLYSTPFAGKMSWSVLDAIGQMISGKIGITEMSGPIGTVKTIADYSIMDWRFLLLFLPLIAANLGIFNLLPIPALDGSKVVFTIIEWIRKKPIKRSVENMIHFVGIIVLFSFVIFVDLFGLFTSGCG